MTVRTVSNLPAAMHVETARCLFAIELSKQSWVVGFITPLSAKISRRILSGGDWKGLLDLIEEVLGSIAIWLLRVGQPKEADGVGQHGRCERYARACFGDPPGRSTLDRVHHVNLTGLFRISPTVGLKNCYTRLQEGKVIAVGN
jgi:hypothetical protein